MGFLVPDWGILLQKLVDLKQDLVRILFLHFFGLAALWGEWMIA